MALSPLAQAGFPLVLCLPCPQAQARGQVPGKTEGEGAKPLVNPGLDAANINTHTHVCPLQLHVMQTVPGRGV